jgi:hypothetical protein
LSASGGRHYFNGDIYYLGKYGYYWTSSVDGGKSRYLHVDTGRRLLQVAGTAFHSFNRGNGFSVRCVRDLH